MIFQCAKDFLTGFLYHRKTINGVFVFISNFFVSCSALKGYKIIILLRYLHQNAVICYICIEKEPDHGKS